tara:strand:- start:250 stop:1083 length:834 start_codon:yes stop_codon:yes gene_type:complete
MIIWISSYPKSGNTWVRYFLKSYFEPFDKKLTLKSTKLDDFYTLNFPNLPLLKELNIDYSNFANIIKNWIPMQSFINLNNRTNFCKTHNAMCTINNYPFTNKENTLGAIYIVRDPRDVVLSYANHLQLSHEETVERMFDSKNGEFQPGEKGEYNSTLTGSWSDNYNSWKSYKSSKILIIKYEDLIDNSFIYFSKIIKYLSEISEVEYDEKKINQSIEKTAFDKLRSLEEKEGFEEKGLGKYFFRSGKKGSWRSQLDVNLSRKIRSRFKKEMDELNYI